MMIFSHFGDFNYFNVPIFNSSWIYFGFISIGISNGALSMKMDVVFQ